MPTPSDNGLHSGIRGHGATHSVFHHAHNGDEKCKVSVQDKMVTSVAKSRARVAQSLLFTCDVPPKGSTNHDVSLEMHLSTRYVPHQVPFSSLACAELLSADDVDELSRIFKCYNVLANTSFYASVATSSNGTADEEADGSGVDGIFHSTNWPPHAVSAGHDPPRRKRYGDCATDIFNDGRFTRSEDDCALTKEWLVELLLSIVASNMEPVVVATLNDTADDTLSAMLCAPSRLAGDNEEPLAMWEGSESTGQGEDRAGTLVQRSMESTAEGSLLACLDHNSQSFDCSPVTLRYHVRKRLMREALLGKYREELESWVRPLSQPCEARACLPVWERCEMQTSLLKGYQDMMPTEAWPSLRPLQSSGSFFGNSSRDRTLQSNTVCRQTTRPFAKTATVLHTGSTDEETETGGGLGVSAFHSTSCEKKLRFSVDVDTAAGHPPLSIPSGCNTAHMLDFTLPDGHLHAGFASCIDTFAVSPHALGSTGTHPTSSSFRRVVEPSTGSYGMASSGNELNVEKPQTTPQKVRGENEKLVTWREMLHYPERLRALDSSVAKRLSLKAHANGVRQTAAGQGSALPNRESLSESEGYNFSDGKTPSCTHWLVCWSDLTSNLIRGFEGDNLDERGGVVYNRVETMILEEGSTQQGNDGVSHHSDSQKRGSDASYSDVDDTDPEGMNTTAMGGTRGRRLMRKRKCVNGPSEPASMDTETFAENLNGLHRQSADCALVSSVHNVIVSSSKDGVVKVWDAKRGQFITNLLNVGSAWVLSMFFLHDDQYLLIATSNAELTVLEFPAGNVAQKYRGCVSFASALRSVPQLTTANIQKYGMRAGECGPHRVAFRESLEPSTFHAMRHKAQFSHGVTHHPAKQMKGFITPTAFFFDSRLGLAFVGSASGAIAFFDLSEEMRQSALHAGANTSPVPLGGSQQTHSTGLMVTGILYCHTGSCITSCGQDGLVVRTPLLFDVHTKKPFLGQSFATVSPQNPIRFMEFCPHAKLLATAHSNRTVLLWSIGRHFTEPVHQYPQEAQDIISVSFLPQRQHIALMMADKSIKVYDVRGFRPLTTITQSRQNINQVEDVATATMKLSTEDPDGALVFHPERKRLVCVLRGPVIYDLYEPGNETRAAGTLVPPLQKLKQPSMGDEDARLASSATRRSSRRALASGLPHTTSDEEAPSVGDKVSSGSHGPTSRRQLAAARTAAERRASPFVTHRHGVIDVLIHRSSGVLHTFCDNSWATWDLKTGILKSNVIVPQHVRKHFPLHRRALLNACAWSTSAQTRLIAGCRSGVVATLDGIAATVVQVEQALTEKKSDLNDTDISVVVQHGNRVFLCSGRTCVIRRFIPGQICANGAEESTSLTIRIPSRSTITACCVVRDTHVCLGTIDTKLFFFRMVEGSAPYHEETLRYPGSGRRAGQRELGAVVGLFFLNECNQNLLLIILDTGVLQVYSYLHNTTLFRFRLFRAHECRICRAVHIPGENLLLCGDSLGRVGVLDVSRLNAEGCDMRGAVSLDCCFQAATDEVSAIEYFAFHQRVDEENELPQTGPTPMETTVEASDGESTSEEKAFPTAPSLLPVTYHCIIVGSRDGNVRLYRLRLADVSHCIVSMSTADNPTSRTALSGTFRMPSSPSAQVYPVMIGLLGFDTWSLSDPKSFCDAEPLPVVRYRQDEHFLDTLLAQARHASINSRGSQLDVSVSEKQLDRFPTTVSLTNANIGENCLSSGGTRAISDAAATTSQTVANAVVGGTFMQPIQQTAPSAVVGSGNSVAVFCPPFGRALTSGCDRPPPLTVPPCTPQSLMPNSPSAAQSSRVRSPNNFAGRGGDEAPAEDAVALLNSVGPQRKPISLKQTRNPLVKKYPSSLLQQLGLARPTNRTHSGTAFNEHSIADHGALGMCDSPLHCESLFLLDGEAEAERSRTEKAMADNLCKGVSFFFLTSVDGLQAEEGLRALKPNIRALPEPHDRHAATQPWVQAPRYSSFSRTGNAPTPFPKSPVNAKGEKRSPSVHPCAPYGFSFASHRPSDNALEKSVRRAVKPLLQTYSGSQSRASLVESFTAMSTKNMSGSIDSMFSLGRSLPTTPRRQGRHPELALGDSLQTQCWPSRTVDGVTISPIGPIRTKESNNRSAPVHSQLLTNESSIDDSPPAEYATARGPCLRSMRHRTSKCRARGGGSVANNDSLTPGKKTSLRLQPPQRNKQEEAAAGREYDQRMLAHIAAQMDRSLYTTTKSDCTSGAGVYVEGTKAVPSERSRKMHVVGERRDLSRHLLEHLGPTPKASHRGMPQIFSRQKIQPVNIVIPSSLRKDPIAVAQMQFLRQLCATSPVPEGTTHPSGNEAVRSTVSVSARTAMNTR